ncbi:MAG: fibrillarin-like rRNA/tRNA 2'-O-methyltransferase [Methanosarcinales archaeon]|jgi:fibrillarin-like pre-rRNA processing protein|nr:fibrillarin-like rRNA/tRNA 2'-O-methyltransferase [Methanosarcinales archaeon]
MTDFLKPYAGGVYEGRARGKFQLYTKNAAPGFSVYGEKTMSDDNGTEYRSWDPKRSKLGALYQKKLRVPLASASRVLYLGAANGTTVSHVSDILAEGGGIVYAVEFSERPMRDLVMLAEKRNNIIPIFSDASRPELYFPIVEPVDLIFQDVAQANQAEIACRNAAYFLRDGGHLILSIKARSVDVAKNPKKIFTEEIKTLEKNADASFKILKTIDLAPFHTDHMGVIAVKNLKE